MVSGEINAMTLQLHEQNNVLLIRPGYNILLQLTLIRYSLKMAQFFQWPLLGPSIVKLYQRNSFILGRASGLYIGYLEGNGSEYDMIVT